MARKSRTIGKKISGNSRTGQGNLSQEEQVLWRQMTEDVVHLKKQPDTLKPALSPLPTQTLDEEDEMGLIVRKQDPAYMDHFSEIYPDSATGQIGSLYQAGLEDMDRRQQERFRKGKLTLEGRLDLHGLTQKNALRSLMIFIPEHRSLGHRCVLVITGKGAPVLKMSTQRYPYHDSEEMQETGRSRGILRDMVPVWLSSSSLKPHILAFCRAQPQDGGSGALYIMLKKNKLR